MNRHMPLLALVAALSFTAGLLARFPVALAAEPTTGDLLTEIRTLQTKVAALETSVTTTRTGPTLEQTVANLQSQLNAIGQVLTISSTGVQLKTAGNITLEAGSNMLLKAMGDSALTAGVTLAASAGSTVNISGKGATSVSGSYVRLNGGTKPVAVQGGTSATVTVP
jgi:uncharacterized protein (DUF2345 family)